MATATQSTSEPTSAGGELDLAQSIREIEGIDSSSPEGAARLTEILSAADDALKLAAIPHLDSPKLLQELCREPALSEAAGTQLCRILAGTIASTLQDSERFQHIEKLDPQLKVQVGLQTRHKPTAETVISSLKSNQDLLSLAKNAKSVHSRKAAAMAIDDQSTLSELLADIKGKEKTVSAAIENKLQSLAESTEENKTADSEPVSSNKEKAAVPSAKAAGESDPALLRTEIEKANKELEKLGTKNTAQLTSLGRKASKIKKQLAGATEEIEALFTEFDQRFQEKLRLNTHYQEQLRSNTEELLQKLEQALADGRSDDALPAWDKIQGNISNTGGKIRNGLQKLANVHKATLTELRDWKSYAATEKKKSLIEQMQKLIESKMHAADRSRRISAMHAEWKSLGRSSNNEELWREFKTHSDEAYKPCKEYFKERKQLMAENLKQRREICEQLEQALQSLDKDNPMINELNKLISEADKNWKKYAPVEQSKIKTLQKRYYGTLNDLRKIRKSALKINGDAKKQCIARAEALSELEDRNQAMEEAKKLQKEWKTIGPTSFKEDKNFWDQFRAACDKIFEKRNQESAVLREELQTIEQDLKRILGELKAIEKLDDEALRERRGEYRELIGKFSSSFDPRLRREGKKLQESFNKLRRNVDGKFKRLPDKKQQERIDALNQARELLQAWEKQLLDARDQNQFKSRQQALDTANWDSLKLPGDSELSDPLQERFAALGECASLEEFQALAGKAEERLHKLCVQLEISAGIDSPQEDQELRMQLQLDQLQQGFGHARATQQAPAQQARDSELRAKTIGPLPEAAEQKYAARLEQAIRKLV